jgi:hypothetical protein
MTPTFLEDLCTPGLTTEHRRREGERAGGEQYKRSSDRKENLDIKAIAGKKSPLVMLCGGHVLQSGATGMISLGLTTTEVTRGVAISKFGHAVAQSVEARRYKSEGHGFDSRWCHWNFSLT